MAPQSSRRPVYALRCALCAVLSLILQPSIASAHHSFVVVYDVQRTVQVQGTVTRFQHRNPHAVLQVQVRSADGSAVTWVGEWASRVQLLRDGVAPDALRPGDAVVVTGSPSRDASLHLLRVQGVQRLRDGWTWRGITP